MPAISCARASPAGAANAWAARADGSLASLDGLGDWISGVGASWGAAGGGVVDGPQAIPASSTSTAQRMWRAYAPACVRTRALRCRLRVCVRALPDITYFDPPPDALPARFASPF